MTIRPPISSPTVTAALAASSATTPAARLVIQKRCVSAQDGHDCPVVTAGSCSSCEDCDVSDDCSDCVVVAGADEAVVVAAVCEPIEPVAAIRPQTRAKAPTAAAAIRRRMREMRRARVGERLPAGGCGVGVHDEQAAPGACAPRSRDAGTFLRAQRPACQRAVKAVPALAIRARPSRTGTCSPPASIAAGASPWSTSSNASRANSG